VVPLLAGSVVSGGLGSAISGSAAAAAKRLGPGGVENRHEIPGR